MAPGGAEASCAGWASRAAARCGARADAELLECVGQVRLDGAGCHVQPLGDGAVAVPAGGQLGDAVLGRRQRAGAAECAAPWPGAGRVELLVRAAGQQQHAALVGLFQGPAERGAGVGPPVGSAQRGAQGEQGAGVLEPGRRSSQDGDRLLQQGERVGRGAGEQAQGGAAGARRAELLAELELLPRQPLRLARCPRG